MSVCRTRISIRLTGTGFELVDDVTSGDVAVFDVSEIVEVVVDRLVRIPESVLRSELGMVTVS